MKEFIKKLIERLEEYKRHVFRCNIMGGDAVRGCIRIVNQLAEEYNNDFCKWNYDEFVEKWQTDCGTLFTLHDSERDITNFCPCCGKKIKVVE